MSPLCFLRAGSEMLSVASFNVNGIRAFCKSKPLAALVTELEVDVLCLQETKLSVGDEAVRHELAGSLDGWEVFFNTSSGRAGYAGVACFAKTGLVAQCSDWWTADEPCECEQCGVLKKEGRVLVCELESCVIVNVYVPNGGKEKHDPSLPMKSEFLMRLRRNVAAYREAGKKVIVCGDLNVVANKQDIWYDLCDYEKAVRAGEPCMSKNVAAWLEDMLSSEGAALCDSFRVLHPSLVKYSWFDAKVRKVRGGFAVPADESTDDGARGEPRVAAGLHSVIARTGRRHCKKRANHLVTFVLLAGQVEADILQHIRGSDHCPVLVRLKLPTLPRAADAPLPALCISRKNTKMQKSIMSFFGGIPSAAKKLKSSTETGGAK